MNIIYEYLPYWSQVKTGDFLHMKLVSRVARLNGEGSILFRFRTGEETMFLETQVANHVWLSPLDPILFRVTNGVGREYWIKEIFPVYNTYLHDFIVDSEWIDWKHTSRTDPRWRGVQKFSKDQRMSDERV